jgi:hypothetical protein
VPDGNARIVSSPVAVTRWAVLAALAVALAACGETGGDTPTPKAQEAAAETKPKPPPNNSAQLAKLLGTRARALAAGDDQGFLDTSMGAQAKRDKRAIAAAKALPLDTVQLSADAIEIEGRRATVRVSLSYSFEGVETSYHKTSRMTAEKTPEGWRISNDRPSAGTLAPWEFTRYKAHKSRHFLALAPRDLRVGKLMTDLEKGRSRMRRGLPGVKPPERVLVIVARNGRDINALTKNRKSRRSVVAVAESQFATTGAAKRISRVWGERVFVLWRSYRAGSTAERRQVVAHELVHSALAHRTSARTPPWLYEGIALYGSGDNRSGDAGALISGRGVLRNSGEQARAKAAMSLRKLSRPRALEQMSSVGISFAYAYSSSTAYLIARRHGPKALLRLLTAYNSDKNKGSGHKLADRVVRRTLKTSLKTLEGEVDAYASANSKF